MRRHRRGRDVLYRVSARLGVWPRRLAAVTCLLLAGLTFLSAHAATPARTPVPVVVAAHDLAAGRVLTRADVSLVQWPAGVAPVRALHAADTAVGSVLAGAMTAGEPLTAARLQGRGLAVGLPSGQVAMALDLADTGSARLIQGGDLVDLLAGGGTDDLSAARNPHVIAQAVRVLAVMPGTAASDRSSVTTTRVVVAVDTAAALRIAGSLSSQIVATLRPST